MQTVYITFPNNLRTYAYQTKLHFVVGGKYKIVNESGFNYDNATVTVKKLSKKMDPAATRFIIKATPIGNKTVPTATQSIAKPKKIIWQEPYTIVLWDDNTKTTVKCQPDDAYNKKIGFLLCTMKKFYGNDSAFNEVLRQVFPEEYTEE